MSKQLIKTLDGSKVWATVSQAQAIDSLSQANRGGCAAVEGYVPTTGYTVPPKIDIQMITRFSTDALYRRKRDALHSMQFEDVQSFVEADKKLNALSEDEQVKLFEARKEQEVTSLNKTLAGDRSDSHRQAHNRCYARFADGVKANLVCEKVDGVSEPVITDGYPSVKSIMIHYLELNRTVVREGERKVVNSGTSVCMKNAIGRALNSRSVGIKTLSLKEDNFDSMTISRKKYLPEDVADIPEEILEG